MILKALISLLFCLLILASGCTAVQKFPDLSSVENGQGSDAYHAPAPAPVYPRSMSEKSSVAGEVTEASDSDVTDSDVPNPSEPKIIKTGDLSLQVQDVRKTADSIGEIARAGGGVVQSSSVTVGSDDQYRGTITIRVPSVQFEGALKSIQDLGKVTSSSISSQDVTEEYVDLDAQKTALEAQLIQYNRILGQAVNVSEILVVQREIERIQVELDRKIGKLKYYDNRISMSTITTRLTEPPQVVTATGYSIASVISEGIAGFSGTVVWLVILIMTLLPLIILGATACLIYRRWKVSRTE
ncbi:MAG: DUF4349 domain-containing protein [Methanospirillum sp.]|uniref:DUF4349 domain-containing protein n=1 Tax=Methanospirillum sp. TaxID=45200 RepID=UPI0023737B49|nr:DUF4349 domain-containing protein [Methanospirillum sp.]MDD1729468.1 DUF4349 domain-containing protein [Methanospirillum sp.]